MKKFCDKITKKDWRVTIPNLTSPSSVFRKTTPTMTPEDPLNNRASSKRSSGFYDFQEAQSEYDKCRSLPNSIYVESSDSDSSDSGGSDEAEERFQDAREQRKSASEADTDQELYVDVEEPKNIDKNNSKYEYDVPRISFKFFERKPREENVYENEPKRVVKSEINIVLERPSEINDVDTLELEETAAATTVAPLSPMKSGSDPNLRAKTEDDFDDDDDEEIEGFYKVPRSLKIQHRLSRSLSDFDPETMDVTIATTTSNQSSIEHISCSQVDIAREKLALARGRSSSPNDSIKLDYCKTRSKLPVSMRRATLLRKPKKAMDSWNHFKRKMSTMLTEQAAQQRVGAFGDKEQRLALNLEGMYKSSKDKCKRVIQNTGKIISTRLNQSRKSESASEAGSLSNSPTVAEKSAGKDYCGDKTTKPKLRASDIQYKLNIVEENDATSTINGVSECDNNYSPMSKIGSEMSDDTRDGGGGREGEEEEFDFSTIKSAFKKKLAYAPEGQNGFEDLRRYVKQGGDFCKELATILQERAEAETQYAKSLSKLSAKLSRACREGVGGLNEAWKAVSLELESKAEAHRIAGNAFLEESAKPLRNLTESQHRSRKQCEAAVEKAARLLGDWRAAEAKGKKQSHACARDNEKLQDAAYIDTSKLGKQTLSKSTSLIHLAHRQNSADKENAKLEGKKKKAEDAVKKADIEYYTLCVRSERARLEWESAVSRGVSTFQSLEEERLSNLKMILASYLKHNMELQPRIAEATERLRAPIEAAEPTKDIVPFQNLRHTSQQVSEQLLPDFYCEHITLAMNRERRKQALVKLLHLIRQDIERERKSKNGLENLSKAIKQTPNFGSEDSQQSVVEKLYHMKSMLTYLEGTRYKVQSALAELDSMPRIGHPLAPHITVTRDKSGLQQSVLKVPHWLREDFFETDRSPVSEKSLKSDNSDPHINDVEDNVLNDDWAHRSTGDGNSNQPDSDFDEFSSQCSSTDNPAEAENVHPIAKCRAIYPYTPNLPDELPLNPGDILNVYRQQDDGWWLGECNGNVGIFPATYVEIVPV